MRNDLNASEKRLIAALDRIDQFLDRSAGARAAGGDTPQLAGLEADLRAARDENARLSQEMVLLQERQSAALDGYGTQLAAAQDRIQALGQEAAQLSAANEALAAANRALSDAATEPADAERSALEAEIESLRAARTAEIAQMGDIMDTLDRMIGTPQPQTSRPETTKAAPQRRAASRDTGGEQVGEREQAGDREQAGEVMLETPPMPREIAGQTVAAHDEDEERG